MYYDLFYTDDSGAREATLTGRVETSEEVASWIYWGTAGGKGISLKATVNTLLQSHVAVRAFRRGNGRLHNQRARL